MQTLPSRLSPRRGQAFLVVLAAVAVLFGAAASMALGSEVRLVAQLPEARAASIVRDVSAGGRHLLVETSEASGFKRSLWAVDALTGISRLLLHPARYTVYRQAANGAFVGWVEQSQHRPTAVYVARTDGTTPPLRLSLPPGYSHAGVFQMTVASSGRVTLLVSDQPIADGQLVSGVLSAGSGQSSFTQVVRAKGPHYLQRANVSQNGRVFGLCDEVGHRPGDNGETAEVIAVSSEPQLQVRRATGRFSLPGTFDCLPSDQGTATMIVSQHVSGAGVSQSRDFRSAVVTAGLAQAKPLNLAPGTGASQLEAVSPSGSQALVADHTGTVITVLNLRNGSQTTIHLPNSFRRLGAVKCRVGVQSNQLLWDPGAGPLLYVWDPFANVVQTTSCTPRQYSLVLDIGSRRWARPVLTSPAGRGVTRTCYLPNGRVLVTGSSPGPGDNAARLFLSNPARSSFSLIDSQALGTIYSINCEGAAGGYVYLASEGTGKLYQVKAGAIEGSALTPG
jgi:hypothetical protein